MHLARTWGLACLLTLASSWAVAAPRHATLGRPNGPAIDWYLDRRAPSGKQGILVIAQGSGCSSVLSNRNVEAAKSLVPDFAVVTVEKYGVSPGAEQKGPNDCSELFWANHTVTQRVEDYRAVIDKLKSAPWWNGRLVLFGGSEGGAVVQIRNDVAVEIDQAGAGSSHTANRPYPTQPR